MAPRFGTDGIRGVAGTELTTEIVRALGAAAVGAIGTDVPFLVARDTRESGPSLEDALVDGITGAGGDACRLGVRAHARPRRRPARRPARPGR